MEVYRAPGCGNLMSTYKIAMCSSVAVFFAKCQGNYARVGSNKERCFFVAGATRPVRAHWCLPSAQDFGSAGGALCL